MSAQGFSDLLRISLLARYGGIWLDMTTILIQNLSWLDNLQSNIDVLKLNGD
jgi:mannosyltransferase OCH1-like enzyme